MQALCVSCHDLKDRISLSNWPKAALADAQSELRNCVECNLEEFVKWESRVADKSFPYSVWPSMVLFKMVEQSWDYFRYPCKALVAKMMHISDDRIELSAVGGAS